MLLNAVEKLMMNNPVRAALQRRFDLDPDMVERARHRLSRFGARVKLWTGDVTCIDAENESYDAAFDFGIIHHVPNWRDALAEIYRVLRPGACLYAEEVLRRFIHHPVWRRVLEHPMEDRFDYAEFREGLRAMGFAPVVSRQLWGQFAWFVATKPSS